MIVINIFFTVAVLLSVATFSEASQKLFKVMEPATLNIYNENYASIVIKRLKSVHCRTINLGAGNNKIELIGYTKNNKTDAPYDRYLF